MDFLYDSAYTRCIRSHKVGPDRKTLTVNVKSLNSFIIPFFSIKGRKVQDI